MQAPIRAHYYGLVGAPVRPGVSFGHRSQLAATRGGCKWNAASARNAFEDVECSTGTNGIEFTRTAIRPAPSTAAGFEAVMAVEIPDPETQEQLPEEELDDVELLAG